MEKLMLLFIMCLLCGCASLKYEHPDYGKVEYRRWWSQEIGEVSILISGNPPVSLSLSKQKAEMPEVDKIAEAVVRGLKL